MTCPRCGTPMEPNPDVGWLCLACKDTRTITISNGPMGFKVDGGDLAAEEVLRMLQFAYQVIHSTTARIRRESARTS